MRVPDPESTENSSLLPNICESCPVRMSWHGNWMPDMCLRSIVKEEKNESGAGLTGIPAATLAA